MSSEREARIELPVAVEMAFDLCAAELASIDGRPLAVAGTPGLARALRRWFAPTAPDGALLAGAVVVLPPSRTWLAEVLPPSGAVRLCLVTAGRLSPLFGWSWLTRQSPTFAGSADVVRQAGFEISSVWSLGGVDSLAWAILIRTAARAGRTHLTDRFEFRYRRSFTPRVGTGPAAVTVACGVRG